MDVAPSHTIEAVNRYESHAIDQLVNTIPHDHPLKSISWTECTITVFVETIGRPQVMQLCPGHYAIVIPSYHNGSWKRNSDQIHNIASLKALTFAITDLARKVVDVLQPDHSSRLAMLHVRDTLLAEMRRLGLEQELDRLMAILRVVPGATNSLRQDRKTREMMAEGTVSEAKSQAMSAVSQA